MPEQNPPLNLQNRTDHDADGDRSFVHAMVRERKGVFGEADMLVTQNATPNMSVNVAAGRGAVRGDESTTQGSYLVWNDGAKNLAIATSDPTNGRRDIVVARVRDAFYSGAVNAWALEVVTGTPSATPVVPATPTNAFVLAVITVGAAASSIVNANIADRRPFIGAPGATILYRSSGTAGQDGLPSHEFGRQVFDVDTGRSYRSTGADNNWVYQGVVGTLGGTADTTTVDATRATDQAIAAITWTRVVFNTAGSFNSSSFNSATGVFTAPYAGRYLMTASVCVIPTAASALQLLSFYKNGTAFRRVAETRQAVGSGSSYCQNGSAVIDLGINDTLSAHAYCDVAGNIKGNSLETGLTFMSIYRLP